MQGVGRFGSLAEINTTESQESYNLNRNSPIAFINLPKRHNICTVVGIINRLST